MVSEVLAEGWNGSIHSKDPVHARGWNAREIAKQRDGSMGIWTNG